MKALLLLALAAACASAPGPKQPDVSHRVPVNRTVPVEVQGAEAGRPASQPRQRHHDDEVEWR
jgi:hypothetical protein